MFMSIGVRDGGAGGAVAPPIRAVCRHEFGHRVNIIRAKHNTCLNNRNLGSVTGVNGKTPNLGSVTVCKGTNRATPQNMDPISATTPPPTEYGSRKISATTPPPLNPFGQNSVCPPPNGCWPVRLCL